jgi:hypothetical protein
MIGLDKPADKRAIDLKTYKSIKDNVMNTRLVIRNIALMVVFGTIALTMFTENVRTVQIIGLFACGAVFGAALAAIIQAFKSRKTAA